MKKDSYEIEYKILVYLWLSVSMFIEWVENISSFGLMVSRRALEFPK